MSPVISSFEIPSTIEAIGSMAFDSMPSTSTITVNKAREEINAPAVWYGNANVIYNG